MSATGAGWGLDSQAQALSVWSLKVEDPRIMVSSCMQVQAAKLLQSTTHYNMQLAECRKEQLPMLISTTWLHQMHVLPQAMRATQYACPCWLHGKAFAPLLALVLSALPVSSLASHGKNRLVS